MEFDDAYQEAVSKKLAEREVFWSDFIDKWKNISNEFGGEPEEPQLPDEAFSNSLSSIRNLRSATIAIQAKNLQTRSKTTTQNAQCTSNTGEKRPPNIKKGMIKRKSKESANVEKLDTLDSTATTIAIEAKILQTRNETTTQKAQYTSNTGENRPRNIKKGMIKRKSKESANVEKLDTRALDPTVTTIVIEAKNLQTRNETTTQNTQYTSKTGENRPTNSAATSSAVEATILQTRNETTTQNAQYTSKTGENRPANIKKGTIKRKSKESANVEKLDSRVPTVTTIAIEAKNLQTRNKTTTQNAQYTSNTGENRPPNIKKGTIERTSKESANVEKLDTLNSTVTTTAIQAKNLQTRNKTTTQNAQYTSKTGENRPTNSAATSSAIEAKILHTRNETTNQKAQYTSNTGENRPTNINKGMIKRKSKESANVEKLDTRDPTVTTIAIEAKNLQTRNKATSQKAQYTSNTGENRPTNIKKGMIKRKSKESANVEKLDTLDSNPIIEPDVLNLKVSGKSKKQTFNLMETDTPNEASSNQDPKIIGNHNKRPGFSDAEEVIFLAEVPTPKKPKFMKTDRGLVRRFFIY